MIIFWILAAGLAGLAVLFIIAPLLRPEPTASGDTPADETAMNLALRREQLAELDQDLADGKLDQAQYEAARHDLERETLHDLDTATPLPAGRPLALPGPRLTLAALAFAVPLGAVLLYLTIGNRDIIPQLEAGALAQAQAAGHGGGAEGMPPLDVLVARLEERMAQTPDDAEGWTMLGRTYFAMGDTANAEKALARAYALTPNESTLALAYAEVIAANHERSLEGRPAELIGAVLAAEPDNLNARWLSGMVAFQRGQYAGAATMWKPILPQIDPASEDATELKRLIAEAETRAGTAPGATLTDASPPAAEPAPQSDAAPAAVEVQVTLAPELAARVTPETTLFVYAKAAAGPKMPLAVHRGTAAELPLTVRLDDSTAMMPEMRLSAFPQVIVGARLSPTGQAIAQPGDLEGETGPVPSNGGAPVSVRIERVRP